MQKEDCEYKQFSDKVIRDWIFLFFYYFTCNIICKTRSAPDVRMFRCRFPQASLIMLSLNSLIPLSY